MQVQQVARVPGGLQDSATVGPLVWAQLPGSQVWWPAEVLDPFFMPLTRMLPPGATTGDSSIHPLNSRFSAFTSVYQLLSL